MPEAVGEDDHKKSQQYTISNLHLDQAIKAQDLRDSKNLKTSGRGTTVVHQPSRQASKPESQAPSPRNGYSYVVTSFDAEKSFKEEKQKKRMEKMKRSRFRRNTATPSILSRFQPAHEMNRAFDELLN